MSVNTIFVGPSKAPTTTTNDVFVIDAGITETHTYESEITQYAVEGGSDITDNVRNKNPKVVITGIVSDTPFGKMADIRSKVVTPAQTSSAELDFSPKDTALTVLIGIRDAKLPISIETHLKRYDNMILVNLEITDDMDSGDALVFTAEFQQILIVITTKVTVKVAAPNLGAAAGAKNKPAKKLGTKTWTGMRGILTGRAIQYSSATGKFTYTDDNSLTPLADVPANSQNSAQGSVITGQTTQNGTYYDNNTGNWRNDDGTSMTQQAKDPDHVPGLVEGIGNLFGNSTDNGPGGFL